MKKIYLALLMTVVVIGLHAQPARTIFITGGNFGSTFISYVAALTKKPNPKICFIPTASADDPNSIIRWYQVCAELPVKPYVLRTFLNSSPDQKTFKEIIMSMDAIVVGGGSTLNMMAIWRAQGAGSLCWFTGGITDSRPVQLSFVDCLGFIPTSHCPHYHSEPGRKPLYQQAVLSGKLSPGYACDDKAGILFENEKLIKSVAADSTSHTYFVSVAAGKIKEEELPVEIIR
jgi:peptidase E